MKSLLLLLLIAFAVVGLMAVCWWVPRHLFPIHFSANSLRLIPEEKLPLPVPQCSILKSKFIWKVLTPSVFSLTDGKLLGLKRGTGLLLCHKKYKRKWAFGLLIVHVEEKPVFFRHPLLVHALGGMENQYAYCNCLEGLEQSLKRKVPFIETDLILTSDKKLVCSHGWTKKTYRLTGVPYPEKNPVMSYETFMNTKIHGKFTSIDGKKIVDAMKRHRKLLVELDLRTIEKDVAQETCEKIVETFEHRKDLLHRLLVQVGSPDMYEGIDSVYHFPYYQYFVHKAEALDPLPVIQFCKEKGIVSLALKDSYFTPVIRDLAREHGLCLLVYTVDDVAAARGFLADGADTICSNFLSLPELTTAP